MGWGPTFTPVGIKQKQPKCCEVAFFRIHPRKLTWTPEMEVWKIIFLFKGVIFRFHVSFRRSTWIINGLPAGPSYHYHTSQPRWSSNPAASEWKWRFDWQPRCRWCVCMEIITKQLHYMYVSKREFAWMKSMCIEYMYDIQKYVI